MAALPAMNQDDQAARQLDRVPSVLSGEPNAVSAVQYVRGGDCIQVQATPLPVLASVALAGQCGLNGGGSQPDGGREL